MIIFGTQELIFFQSVTKRSIINSENFGSPLLYPVCPFKGAQKDAFFVSLELSVERQTLVKKKISASHSCFFGEVRLRHRNTFHLGRHVVLSNNVLVC